MTIDELVEYETPDGTRAKISRASLNNLMAKAHLALSESYAGRMPPFVRELAKRTIIEQAPHIGASTLDAAMRNADEIAATGFPALYSDEFFSINTHQPPGTAKIFEWPIVDVIVRTIAGNEGYVPKALKLVEDRNALTTPVTAEVLERFHEKVTRNTDMDEIIAAHTTEEIVKKYKNNIASEETEAYIREGTHTATLRLLERIRTVPRTTSTRNAEVPSEITEQVFKERFWFLNYSGADARAIAQTYINTVNRKLEERPYEFAGNILEPSEISTYTKIVKTIPGLGDSLSQHNQRIAEARGEEGLKSGRVEFITPAVFEKATPLMQQKMEEFLQQYFLGAFMSGTSAIEQTSNEIAAQHGISLRPFIHQAIDAAAAAYTTQASSEEYARLKSKIKTITRRDRPRMDAAMVRRQEYEG